MTTEIERVQNGALARPEDVGGYQPMRPLDVYAGGLSEEAPRVDAIATISCGRLVEGKPRAARRDDKQWIFVHDPNDRAIGLTQALQAGDGRRLTIAFQFDDPAQFIQQRFTEYTASALKVYGDEKRITEIIVHGEGNRASAEHRTFDAGTPDYERLVQRCKVNVSVYFALAEWSPEGPRVTFPDGLGLYRLRFTSRNSLRNLLATIDYVAKFTRGRVAGIPFNLGVDFREVARSTGIKTTIPVFTFTMAPPGGITSLTFRSLTGQALAQGANLHMLPPTVETWETATMDGPVGDDITEEQAAILERGGKCDKRHYTKLWHALVRDTSLASKEGRAEFLDRHTDMRFDSLSLFLDQATESEASFLIECARDYLVERGELTAADDVDDDDDTPAKPPATAADYEASYGAAYADQDAAKPAETVIDTESREVASPADQMEALADQVGGDEMPTKSVARQKLEDGYTKLVGKARAAGLDMPDLNPEWTDEDLEGTGKHWMNQLVGVRKGDGLASGV